jgi:hypothetical protein
MGTPRCKFGKVQSHRWDSETGGQGARSGEKPPVRSSVKPSHAANDNLKDELIGRTLQVWQPRLSCDLSSEDARQIAENVAGFFSVLAEWSRADMPAPANDTNDSGTSQNGWVSHDR